MTKNFRSIMVGIAVSSIGLTPCNKDSKFAIDFDLEP